MKLYKAVKHHQRTFLSHHPQLREKLNASVGSFIAIWLLMSLINQLQLTTEMQLLVLASMGASTFLLFVVPHSPMAQPWPLMSGHIIAAIMGVTSDYWITDPIVATAIAVGLAVLLMHFLNALHPPAAATAIIAVVGLPDQSHIAWQFVYVVVILNAGSLLFISLLINNLLPGRHYPQCNTHHKHHDKFIDDVEDKMVLKEVDFDWALLQIEAVIDVSNTDLIDLYEFAVEHAQQRKLKQKTLK